MVNLADRPDEVIADAEVRDLLVAVDRRLGGRVAVVSGRSIAQLDAMLGPVAGMVALSGSHGHEHRWQGVADQPPRPATLDDAAVRLRTFAERHPGSLVEEKSYGVALHYRLCPDAGDAALALARTAADDFDLHLQPGKMMVELRVRGGDKGAAVRRMMGLTPMAGTRPIFVGDDRTDEHGFQAAVDLGGAGIFVGEPGDTAARYRLADPAAVRAWLKEIAA